MLKLRPVLKFIPGQLYTPCRAKQGKFKHSVMFRMVDYEGYTVKYHNVWNGQPLLCLSEPFVLQKKVRNIHSGNVIVSHAWSCKFLWKDKVVQYVSSASAKEYKWFVKSTSRKFVYLKDYDHD